MKKLLLILLLLSSFKAYSQTIHFMLFAATNDSELGSAAENVKKYFQYTFVSSLTKYSGKTVNANYYCGSMFTKPKLESVINNLHTSSGDIIIFYFYGHGFNDCRPTCPNPNEFPTITLGENDGPINPRMKSELEIFNTLKNKPHKLLITIAESCNRCLGGSCSPVPVINSNPVVDLSPQKLAQLFSASGDYIVSSSSKGEYSYSGNMGFFTSELKNAFESELSYNKSEYPDWNNIFDNASMQTARIANAHKDREGNTCVQHPQWKKIGQSTSPPVSQPKQYQSSANVQHELSSRLSAFVINTHTSSYSSSSYLAARHYHHSGTSSTSSKYIGEKSNGQYNGFGIYKWDDGSIYCGYWINGHRQENGIMINLSTQKIWIGIFDDIEVSNARIYDFYGNKTNDNESVIKKIQVKKNTSHTYIGETDNNGYYSGTGLYFTTDGDAWFGQFNAGVPFAEGVWIHTNGTITHGKLY
ncbi:MAG: caspase family protein [Bacteroidales bacterium]|nr:caspase family protein [Bacteroidales bacterium]